jgi:hypothetical protein
VMEVFEVFGIAGQNWHILGDRKDRHSRIRDGQQSYVRSEGGMAGPLTVKNAAIGFRRTST